MAFRFQKTISHLLRRISLRPYPCTSVKNSTKYAGSARTASCFAALASKESQELSLKELSTSALSPFWAPTKGLYGESGGRDGWLESLALLGVVGTCVAFQASNAASLESRQFAVGQEEEQTSGHGVYSEELHRKLVGIVGVSQPSTFTPLLKIKSLKDLKRAQITGKIRHSERPVAANAGTPCRTEFVLQQTQNCLSVQSIRLLTISKGRDRKDGTERKGQKGRRNWTFRKAWELTRRMTYI